jgi:superfamily II DNA or RNA helicase
MSLVKPMRHQAESLRFMTTRPSVLDFSDCGTGKTLVEILDFAKRHKVDGKAMLVLCPKSIMYAAWAQDIKKFAPHLKVSLCYAQN